MNFFYHKLSTRVGLTLLSLIGMPLYIILIINLGVSFYTIIFVLLILFNSYLLIKLYSQTINIGDDGITYRSINKKYKIAWKDIKHIDIRGMGLGMKSSFDVLCISKEYINAFKIDITEKNMNDDFIMVLNINRKLISQIERHWNGKVNGVNVYFGGLN